MNRIDITFGKDGCSHVDIKSRTKNDCCTHECEYCGVVMKFQWKLKGTCKNKVGGVGGIYHTVHASRHLYIHCNESCRNSIKERSLEKVQNEINTKKMLQQRLNTSKRN